MDSLNNSGAFKFMDCFFHDAAILACKYKFSLTGTRNFDFNILIHITISMSCNNNRLLPVLYKRFYAFNNNRSTEYCTVKNSTDCSVRTLPHLLKVIFCHSRRIRCDCGTFYGNLILLSCIACINSNLIISLISIFESKIIILCIEINKRNK